MTVTIKWLSGRKTFRNPPDGGYAWVVAFACFWICGLSFTIHKGFGLFYEEIKEDLGINNSETSTISSLIVSTFGIAGVFSNTLINSLGTRTVMIVGGILSTTGMAIFYASDSLLMFIIGAVISGLGSGSSFIISYSQLNLYFSTNRGLANGFVMAGSPAYSFIFPFISTTLTFIYGWRGCLLIVGGINLQICVFASLIAPIEYNDDKTESNENIVKSKQSLPNRLKNFFQIYWVGLFLLFSNFIFQLSFITPYVYIVPYIESIGYTTAESALLLSVSNVGDLSGRILCGFVIKRFLLLQRNMIFCTAFVVLCYAITQLIVILSNTYTYFFIYSILLGFFYGSSCVFCIASIPLTLGSNNLHTYISWYFVSGAISALLNGYIAGSMVDYFGNYLATFIYTCLGCFVSSMLVFICHLIIKCRGKVF